MATPKTPGRILASNVGAARVRLGLDQQDLAERMRGLGWKWVRQTVGEVENNRRRLTAEETFALAYALEVGVLRLMSPIEEDHWVAFPNGKVVHALHGIARMRGTADGAIRWEGNTPVFMADSARFGPADDGGEPDYFAGQRQAASVEHPATDPISVEGTLDQPVATAIVTSDLGVLVGRRNDGKPPWTFIAGEVEPGEAPADAAIREVKEETGLRVQLAEVIGERVHPKTGRTMIYIAATPTHGTDAIVGDEEELAEVRWVSLAEADELMAAYGMFEPVHDYLTAKLGQA